MRVVKYKKTKFDGGSEHWADSKKLDVLKTFLVTGNLRASAAVNNVPEVTVKRWKVSQWWKDTEEEIKRGSRIELSARLQKLVSKSMEQLEDRLDNGDFVFTKLGQLVRKPISAEHANKITTQLVDRIIQVDKEVAKEVITDEGLESRMNKLREEMVRFARAKTIQGVSHVVEEPFSESPKPVQQAEASATPTPDPEPSGVCPSPTSTSAGTSSNEGSVSHHLDQQS